MKNEHLPSHDLYLGQNVIMQDCTSKRWSPVVITKRCKEPRSYQVITKEGVTYRKTQMHLKPYSPDDKQDQAAKMVICRHLQKTLIKTLIMITWHSQELGSKLSHLQN